MLDVRRGHGTEQGLISPFRYVGAGLFLALHVSYSECSYRKREHTNRVVWENLERVKTSHAAEFWITCRGSACVQGKQIAVAQSSLLSTNVTQIPDSQ